MDYVLPFEKLTRQSVALVGGKGAQLGEMTSAGISVPPGFAITTYSFDLFIKENNLENEIAACLSKVKPDDSASVEAASREIRRMVDAAVMPKVIADSVLAAFDRLGARYVAVRSSATAEDASSASWAGELETYLNTTRETLLAAVKRDWSSLYTPRAIFYRFEKGLAESRVAVGVVVQKMVQSEVSGVTFTVNPVTQNRSEMVIEAVWGLGEAIVSGAVTPDNYVVDKAEKMLLDVSVAEQEKMLVKTESVGKVSNDYLPVPEEKKSKQKLSGKQILGLAEICANIESHYGAPQDIEWALEGGKFYITQSRPITTLK